MQVHGSGDQCKCDRRASRYTGPAVDEQGFSRDPIGKMEDFGKVFRPRRMDEFILVHAICADNIEAQHCVDLAKADCIWDGTRGFAN